VYILQLIFFSNILIQLIHFPGKHHVMDLYSLWL